MRYIIGSGLLIAALFGLNAQTVAEAKSAFDQANYGRAFELYQQSAEGHLREDDKMGYVKCNLQMTACKILMGQPDEGRQLADQIKPYVEAHFPNDKQFMGELLTLKGKSYLSLGRPALAIEELKKAESQIDPNSLTAATCYNELGVAYWSTENDELARQYLERSLTLRKQQLKANDLLIADTYNNLGLIYTTEEPLQALIFFQRAKNIYDDLFGSRHPKVAQAYNNLAFANEILEDYAGGLENLRESQSIWDELYVDDHPNKAFVLASIGRLQKESGNTDEALRSLADALRMYINLFGTKHPEVANVYDLIGKVHQRNGEYEEAVESYQRAIYANLLNQSFTSIYELPEISEFFNPDQLLTALWSKAKMLEALHFEKTLNRRDLEGALDTYLLCDDLITLLRQTRQNEQDKIRLGTIAQDVYQNGISLALLLADRSFNRKEYLRVAFEFTERSKSAVLLEAITETKAKEFAGLPAQVLETEDSLKAEIAFFEQQLAQGNDAERYKQLLFTYQSAYRKHINDLEVRYPAYYQLKYNQAALGLDDVQAGLPEGSSLLSYFIGDKVVHVFVVTKKGIKAYSKTTTTDLDKLVIGLRNSIQYRSAETTEQFGKELYDLLIPKRLEGEHLVILPDSYLATLPFEALQNPRSKSTTYLIEEYGISYDYSASLMLSRTMEFKASGILLCAPVQFSDNDVPMTTLPETEREIREIKLLFGNEAPVETLLREEASEASIRAKTEKPFQFLHFATHGQVNESQPELSRIFLHPDAGDDGNLFTGEIYNMRVQADLVTLSACETGLGQLAKGEGIVGLSRALQYAGANNLIVSLWPVADASTSEFMIDFYEYKLHKDPSEGYQQALRKSKLDMIRDPKYGAPYYWAPFILVGK